MKFNCSSADFINTLSIAAHALSGKSTVPALEYVMMETDDEDNVIFTCSDGTLTIVSQCKVEIDEGGSVLLPGKLLIDVVRKIPEGMMTVSTMDNSFVQFRCGGSRTKIAYRASNIYPRVDRVKDSDITSAITLPQSLLKDMIQRTSFAIATTDERPILTGCYLDVQGGMASMVALDGFRMAIRMQRISEEAAFNAVIPGKALQEIARILSDDDEDMIDITICKGKMYTRIGETQVYAVLKEGEFIPYRNLLPKDATTVAKVECEDLMRCVDRASLIAREGKNNLVRFEIGEDRIIITSNSELGDVYEEVEAEVEGEPLVIAFNVKYISEALRSMENGNVTLKCTTGIKPCVIVPTQGDSFVHLVLPVRITV